MRAYRGSRALDYAWCPWHLATHTHRDRHTTDTYTDTQRHTHSVCMCVCVRVYVCGGGTVAWEEATDCAEVGRACRKLKASPDSCTVGTTLCEIYTQDNILADPPVFSAC